MFDVTIGELIDALRTQPYTEFRMVVTYGCWHGDPQDLGIGVGYPSAGTNFGTTHLAESLRGSLTRVFFDAKGEQYIMGHSTLVHLSDFGSDRRGADALMLARVFSRALHLKHLRDEHEHWNKADPIDEPESGEES